MALLFQSRLCQKVQRHMAKCRRIHVASLIIAFFMCWYFMGHKATHGKNNDLKETSARPLYQHINENENRESDMTEDEKILVKTASAIAQVHGVVLFSVINDAYTMMAASWLCNTAPFATVHHKVLFVTTDEATGQKLQQEWPNIKVVFVNESKTLSGSKSYTTVAYVRLMVARTRYIQRLVQARIPLLLFEVDFVWLADPLPRVLSFDVDVAGIPVYGTNGTKTCGCFLLLNPTPATSRLWSRLTEMMEKLEASISLRKPDALVSQATNDQIYLSRLLVQGYGGVKVAHLPEHEFRDGKWYWHAQLRAAKPPPLIIHNNYANGIISKIARAKRFKHWFLTSYSTSSNFVCDADAVREVISPTPKSE